MMNTYYLMQHSEGNNYNYLYSLECNPKDFKLILYNMNILFFLYWDADGTFEDYELFSGLTEKEKNDIRDYIDGSCNEADFTENNIKYIHETVGLTTDFTLDFIACNVLEEYERTDDVTYLQDNDGFWWCSAQTNGAPLPELINIINSQTYTWVEDFSH